MTSTQVARPATHTSKVFGGLLSNSRASWPHGPQEEGVSVDGLSHVRDDASLGHLRRPRASNFSSRMTMANSDVVGPVQRDFHAPATREGRSPPSRTASARDLASSWPSYHIFGVRATSLSLSVKRPIRSPGKFCSSQSHTPTSASVFVESAAAAEYMGWSHLGRASSLHFGFMY